MKEKIIYISETEKVFENKKDCIKEDYNYYITKLYELNTIFFDEECNPIQKEVLMENEELCQYIYIPNSEAIDIFKEMSYQNQDTILFIDDTNDTGLYEYDLYCKKYLSTIQTIEYAKKLMEMIDFAESR